MRYIGITMTTDEQTARARLLETGTLVEFEVTSRSSEPSPDGETSSVRVELQLGGPDDGDGEDQAQWGGFGILFVLAALSFHDARPRGYSEKQFLDDDELTVSDFFEGLRFVRGELHYDADYVRGRCVKTEIVVRRDGSVRLETRGRGESALRWIERLQGKKMLELVP
jgi:hypothetical protein